LVSDILPSQRAGGDWSLYEPRAKRCHQSTVLGVFQGIKHALP